MDQTNWEQQKAIFITQLTNLQYSTVLTDEQVEGAFLKLAYLSKFDFDTSFVKINQEKYALLFGLKKLWDDPDLASKLTAVFGDLKAVITYHFEKLDRDLLVQVSQAIQTDPLKRAEIEAIINE